MNKKQTEWVTNLHDHPLAVVNSFGAGIYAPICSNELSVKHLSVSGLTEILVSIFCNTLPQLVFSCPVEGAKQLSVTPGGVSLCNCPTPLCCCC